LKIFDFLLTVLVVLLYTIGVVKVNNAHR